MCRGRSFGSILHLQVGHSKLCKGQSLHDIQGDRTTHILLVMTWVCLSVTWEIVGAPRAFFLGHRETSASITPTLSNSFYGGPTVKNQLHDLDRDFRDSTPYYILV